MYLSVLGGKKVRDSSAVGSLKHISLAPEERVWAGGTDWWLTSIVSPFPLASCTLPPEMLARSKSQVLVLESASQTSHTHRSILAILDWSLS